MSARVIKSGVARGHVQIHVGLTRNVVGEAAPLNRAMFHAYMAAFREAAQLYAIEAQPDVNSALRIPGMLSTGDEEELGEAVTKALLEAAAEAVAVLNRGREREGAATAQEMRQRCRNICELVSRMEEIRAGAVAAFQKRLREKLADLLRGAGIEPQRLAQEAAILADRSDIAEELMRLRTHAAPAGSHAERRRRNRQTAGFPVAGDESRVEYGTVEDGRPGRSGLDHHRPGPEREERDRQDQRAELEP